MIDLLPKSQFQKLRKEDSEKFANIVVEPAMRTAITYALANMVAGPITAEELNGARKFIKEFTELSDEIKKATPMPSKELSQ